MSIKPNDKGTWTAEGYYDDRLIIVEGATRNEARINWEQTASGGMSCEFLNPYSS